MKQKEFKTRDEFYDYMIKNYNHGKVLPRITGKVTINNKPTDYYVEKTKTSFIIGTQSSK